MTVAAWCPQALLLDFDHTLFAFDDSIAWLRAASQDCAVTTDEVELQRLFQRIEAARTWPEVVEAQRGCQRSPALHREAILFWFQSAGAGAVLAEALYRRLTTPPGWLPYADVPEVLAALHRRGVAVAVVSNVGWDIRPTFAHYDLEAFVNTFVLSCEQGTEKPAISMFLAACAALGADPWEVLMVGDDPVSDGAALRTGAQVYLLPDRPRGGVRGLTPVLNVLAESRDDNHRQ
jgi:HAD superfamily hydrolase (TIGR01493 family)